MYNIEIEQGTYYHHFWNF